METPVEKLLKILRLEAEEGYRDRAVIGGLVRFAETWNHEAQAAFGPGAAAWVRAVGDSLHAYSQLPEPSERERALLDLQELLRRGPAAEPEVPTAAVAATQPEPPPAPTMALATMQPEPPPAPAVDVAATQPEPPPAPTPSVPPAPKPAPPSQVGREPSGLGAPLTVLRGVGERQARRLARLGLRTIRDLLYFLPRRYDDYSNLKPINRLEYGEDATVVAQVQKAGVQRTRSGKVLFKAVLSDDTGYLEVTWFNQPYLADRIQSGRHIVVSGKVDEYLGRLCLVSPEWEPLRKELLHTGRLVPVYSLTEGVSARWLRQLLKRTVEYWATRLPDHLPPSLRDDYRLDDLSTALRQVHFPDSPERLDRARYRLAFDELFVFQLGLLRQRHLWRSTPGRQLPIEDETLQSFVLSLPFGLTCAQQRVLGHIVDDICSPYPMNRLLQGDVGSGKTVVAAAAVALAVAAGTQAAIMAPTEILAEQHYETFRRIFERLPGQAPTMRLLTAGVTGAEREEIYAGLADGSVNIAMGTHALIQEGVVLRDLALVVIDEQHRFGVRQRAALRQKGYNPHLLVMTATPIPRSLQLTLWGHLDVSVIDEMPPGRQPVETRLILPAERERAYAFLRSQVERGRQAFIICPLVEESVKIEAKAAVAEHERLQNEVFSDLRLGLLHGRLSSAEKEGVMSTFARGELDILVTTSVVEVGIDVPNATATLIEGAERFGLAQLHQFRGRVGRGEHASYCLLVSGSASPEAQERLAALEATTDGFVLAEKDLEMRGPGEFMGTRQSGFPDLKMGSLADLRLIETAREAARRTFEDDPEIQDPEHQLLARRVKNAWGGEGEVS
jgi:ATP-dependent DNA helicase RecG